MDYQQILPVTEARGILGKLASSVKGDKVIGLTKGGRVVADLVDPKYLRGLLAERKKVLQRAFYDPDMEKYVREFTDEEIAEWLEADKLE